MKDLKHITVRMIPPPGYAEDSYTFHAPPGRHYSDPQDVLDHVVEYLDKKYPLWDFKVVQVARDKFNFVYAGLREEADGNASAAAASSS
jgi:hypothetical protein